MTNSSQCIEPYESDLVEELCIVARQQQTYWTCSVVILSLGCLAYLRVAWEFRFNRGLRKPPLNYFYIVLIGDVFFIALFLPYHLNNIYLLLTNGEVDVSNNSWCISAAWMTNVALEMQFWGLALVAFIPYRMTENARKMKRATKEKLNLRLIAVTIVGIVVTTLAWNIYATHYDILGSFRGLYCGSRSYDNGNGVFMFGSISGSFSAMAFFYFKSHRTLIHLSKGKIDKSLHIAARNIMKTGIFMVGCLLLSWGPIAITSFLSLVGAEYPIQLDMFAGIMAKFKPLFDVIVLFRMPQVRSGRKILSSSVTSTVATQGTRAASTLTANN